MAFAPPKNMEGPKLQTKMSTWTPLNHQLMNDKEPFLLAAKTTTCLESAMMNSIFLLVVFEERRALLGKWFDKWTDGQRRRILIDLLERCSLSQQKFCAKQLQDRVPAEALDFTTKLPRVLSLYIFSFLDPRSLCRCAQVSWHWKSLTELDQLWMLKCLRFGWYINFSPTPFEQGIWKKHYIEMVKELHVTRPKTPPKDEFVVIDVQPIARDVPEAKLSLSSVLRSASVLGKDKEKKELPPWRSSDKHPTDIVRFNYLDNYDPIEQVRQARKKGGGLTPDLSRQAFEKKGKASSASYKLRKAKSLMSLSAGLGPGPKRAVRPSWATHQSTGYPVTKATAKILAQSAQWNAGIRPAPVRAPVPKLSERGKKAFTRMSRSSPSSPLFEAQPWEFLPSEHGSDGE
ncbi:F-box only protein 16 isoform X3 [Pelodiscus sinensis]|uniref:F-box only protein 16 isoform X3 n=1 Tax=Pelodiscus sinensis TaxID=13735 RepID=UPI003F6D1E1B